MRKRLIHSIVDVARKSNWHPLAVGAQVILNGSPRKAEDGARMRILIWNPCRMHWLTLNPRIAQPLPAEVTECKRIVHRRPAPWTLHHDTSFPTRIMTCEQLYPSNCTWGSYILKAIGRKCVPECFHQDDPNLSEATQHITLLKLRWCSCWGELIRMFGAFRKECGIKVA